MGRPSVNRRIQVGVEVTPGTAVACTKSLPTTDIQLTRVLDTKQYRAMGYKPATIAKIVKDYSTGKVSGPFSYAEIIYPMSTLVTPVITTPGGATLARQWVFTAKARGADAFKTLTVQEGDDTAALQAAYCVLTEFGIDVKLDDSTINGALLGQNLTATSLTAALNQIDEVTIPTDNTGGSFTLTYSGQTTAAIPYNATADNVYGALVALTNIGAGDVIVTGGPGATSPFVIEFTGALAGASRVLTSTPSLTGGTNTAAVSVDQAGGGTGVTTIPTIPIGPREIDVFMDDIGGTIGTTKVGNAMSASFKVANKQGARWVLNTTYSSFRDTIEIVPTLTASIDMEFDSQARTLFASISAQSNPVKLIRIQATSGTNYIEGTTPYSFKMDFAAQIVATAQGDIDGDYAYTFNFLPQFNSTYGNKAWEATIINQQTAL